MSMPIIERPDNPVDREQSVNDLIESVAMMEAGLSHVINAEGEKIQKVVDPDADYPLEDIIAVNNSVEKMINTASKLEMMLQSKLEATKDLDTGGTGPIMQNAYMFAYGTNFGGIPIPMPYGQVLHGFTVNDVNSLFTANVAGVYLISYRNSSDTQVVREMFVQVNDAVIESSRLRPSEITNTNATMFIQELNVGDTICLNSPLTSLAQGHQMDVPHYLCAVKIG